MTCSPTHILGVALPADCSNQIAGRLRGMFEGPIDFQLAATLEDTLAALRLRQIDLALVDAAAADPQGGDPLQAVRQAAPHCAVIAVLNRQDDAASLAAIRRGAHETLSLTGGTVQEHNHVLARAFARVGRNASAVLRPAQAVQIQPEPTALLHDLNNLMTSINGFADLLLMRLAADDPARPSAEQVRLAGKRAAALLKTHRQAREGSPTSALASPQPVSSPVTARAA